MNRPPGVEFHTFTIVGRCDRTGMFGVATATRSLAVGARVPHVKSQTGAIAIMAIADPRLGTAALQFLEQGYKAPTVIDQLVAMDPYAEYRQLGVIDDDGFAAARTGKMNRDYAGHHVGDVLRREHGAAGREHLGRRGDERGAVEGRVERVRGGGVLQPQRHVA